MYSFADQEREFSKALRKERSEGGQDMLVKLVKKGRLTVEEAAEESNMTLDDFKQKYLMHEGMRQQR